ncbi:hypothetical protein [Calothrix sp. PCC 7507]|nr:hypothetical protein [Calothrix sp. PCC 7507]
MIVQKMSDRSTVIYLEKVMVGITHHLKKSTQTHFSQDKSLRLLTMQS